MSGEGEIPEDIVPDVESRRTSTFTYAGDILRTNMCVMCEWSFLDYEMIEDEEYGLLCKNCHSIAVETKHGEGKKEEPKPTQCVQCSKELPSDKVCVFYCDEIAPQQMPLVTYGAKPFCDNGCLMIYLQTQ